MKGLKVQKAAPSNSIDIYALLKEALKEGLLVGKPSERALQQYYFTRLIDELCHPHHFWFIARRGRGYLGFVHALMVPGRWDGTVDSLVVDLVFVTKNRRKHGIGRKLLEELKKEAQNMGIRKFEFVCPDNLVEHWKLTQGAAKIMNVMRVEV